MANKAQRREGAESYAARVGVARRKAVELVADAFERSNIEYRCLKNVTDFAKPELERLAQLPEFQPYNVASYNNVTRVGNEVHSRWRKAQSRA